MTQSVSHVSSYADLDANSKISSRGADMIAQLFNDGTDTVVFVPKWLTDNKDIDPVRVSGGGETLFVGEITDYSSKAWRFEQHEMDPVFLPKSQVHVFRRTTERIETPQHSLYAFEDGDSR